MFYLVLLFWSAVIAGLCYHFRTTDFLKGFASSWRAVTTVTELDWAESDSPEYFGQCFGNISIGIAAVAVVIVAIITFYWAA